MRASCVSRTDDRQPLTTGLPTPITTTRRPPDEPHHRPSPGSYRTRLWRRFFGQSSNGTRPSRHNLTPPPSPPPLLHPLYPHPFRYKAEEELRAKEEDILAQEARLAHQAASELARQQRSRDAKKRERQAAASRTMRRIEEAKRHIATTNQAMEEKVLKSMTLAERRMADLEARRAEERRRRHAADMRRVKKFNDTKAAFSQVSREGRVRDLAHD